MNLFKRILFLVNFLILFINIGISQNYKITHYGVKEGLSSNCVYHCTQDSLGLIWFATDNGLTRFDGKKFKYFGITDGLKKNEVFHIQPISKEILLGYNLNHCFIIDNGRIKFPVSEINKVNALNHFYTDVYNTKVVVSKKDSILIFNKRNFKLINKYPIGLSLSYIDSFNNLKFIPIRKYVLSSVVKGFVNNKDTVFKVNLSNNLEPIIVLKDIVSSFFTKDSNLLINSKSGLYCKRKNQQKAFKIFSHNSLNFVYVDNKSNIWACTSTDGVYLLQKNEVKKFPNIKNCTFRTIKVNSSKAILGGLNCSAEMEKGRLKVTKYNGNEVLYPYYWKSQKRAIFIGQYYLYFSKHDSIKFPYNIKCFSYYSSDTILIGSGAGLYFYDLKNRKLGSKMIDGRIYSLGYGNNKIWAYTEKGIVLIHNGRYQYLKLIKDKDVSISNVMSDKQKNTWISTSGMGVFVLDSQNQVIKNLQEKNGLISNNCKSMFIDDDNRVWLTSNKGLSCIDGLDKIRNYTESNGLPSSDIYDLALIEDTVYVLTSLGLCTFNYIPRTQIYYFPLSITELKIGDSIYSSIPSILKPSSNSIKISY